MPNDADRKRNPTVLIISTSPLSNVKFNQFEERQKFITLQVLAFIYQSVDKGIESAHQTHLMDKFLVFQIERVIKNNPDYK